MSAIQKIGYWMDSKKLNGDILPLHGALLKEQKCWHINTFMEQATEAEINCDKTLNSVLLMATASTANAGIDSLDVRLGFRADLPPSIEDLIQEIGLTGRQENASSLTDIFYICISLIGPLQFNSAHLSI